MSSSLKRKSLSSVSATSTTANAPKNLQEQRKRAAEWAKQQHLPSKPSQDTHTSTSSSYTADANVGDAESVSMKEEKKAKRKSAPAPLLPSHPQPNTAPAPASTSKNSTSSNTSNRRLTRNKRELEESVPEEKSEGEEEDEDDEVARVKELRRRSRGKGGGGGYYKEDRIRIPVRNVKPKIPSEDEEEEEEETPLQQPYQQPQPQQVILSQDELDALMNKIRRNREDANPLLNSNRRKTINNYSQPPPSQPQHLPLPVSTASASSTDDRLRRELHSVLDKSKTKTTGNRRSSASSLSKPVVAVPLDYEEEDEDDAQYYSKLLEASPSRYRESISQPYRPSIPAPSHVPTPIHYPQHNQPSPNRAHESSSIYDNSKQHVAGEGKVNHVEIENSSSLLSFSRPIFKPSPSSSTSSQHIASSTGHSFWNVFIAVFAGLVIYQYLFFGGVVEVNLVKDTGLLDLLLFLRGLWADVIKGTIEATKITLVIIFILGLLSVTWHLVGRFLAHYKRRAELVHLLVERVQEALKKAKPGNYVSIAFLRDELFDEMKREIAGNTLDSKGYLAFVSNKEKFASNVWYLVEAEVAHDSRIESSSIESTQGKHVRCWRYAYSMSANRGEGAGGGHEDDLRASVEEIVDPYNVVENKKVEAQPTYAINYL